MCKKATKIKKYLVAWG